MTYRSYKNITKLDELMPVLIMNYPEKFSDLNNPLKNVNVDDAFKIRFNEFMSKVSLLVKSKDKLLTEICKLDENKHLVFDYAASNGKRLTVRDNPNITDLVKNVQEELVKRDLLSTFNNYSTVCNGLFNNYKTKDIEELIYDFFNDFNYYTSCLRNENGRLDDNQDIQSKFTEVWIYVTECLIKSIIELLNCLDIAIQRVFVHISRGIEWGLDIKGNSYNLNDPYYLNGIIKNLSLLSHAANISEAIIPQ